MERVTLFDYDKLNMKQIKGILEEKHSEIICIPSISIIDKMLKKTVSVNLNQGNFYDITPILIAYGDRIELWATEVIGVLNYCTENAEFTLNFIVDKRYSNDILDTLYHYIDRIDSLETHLGIKNNDIFNVVDINNHQFDELKILFADRLFGNNHFKQRLFTELQKYRLFNRIGEQKVFSAFICGQSGIGKTETARIFHSFLAPNEKFIKINLGNYSDNNALSSLIGSPRGYIGSNKGELSDKILKSKSKIILIDEFEKAGAQVHNFFLELLEDGKFTDSLGREFNLDKYIIIFTSNIKEEDINQKLSAELRSRFNLMYKFLPVSKEVKLSYIEYKCNCLIEKIRCELGVVFNDEEQKRIKGIDPQRYDNLRNINKEIMLRISEEYQSKTGNVINSGNIIAADLEVAISQ